MCTYWQYSVSVFCRGNENTASLSHRCKQHLFCLRLCNDVYIVAHEIKLLESFMSDVWSTAITVMSVRLKISKIEDTKAKLHTKAQNLRVVKNKSFTVVLSVILQLCILFHINVNHKWCHSQTTVDKIM